MNSSFRFLTLVLLAASVFHITPTFADADDDALLAPEDTEDKNLKKVEKPKVGFISLVPVGEATLPDADEVSSAFKNELEEASFQLVDFSVAKKNTQNVIDMTLHQKELKAANTALEKGQKSLKRLSFKSANKAFLFALTNYAKAPAALFSVKGPIQAYLGLAEIAARQGAEDQSLKFLKKAANLNPNFKIPDSYPPQFISQFQSIAKEITNQEQGALLVDSSAKGALVYLDGQEMGKAPLRIRHIPVGEHYIRIFQQDVGLTGVFATIEHDKEQLITPNFIDVSSSKSLELLSQNTFSDEAAAQIAQKAKSEKLVGVIVGVVNRTRTSLPTAMIYIDSASSKVRHLDMMNFDADLLNTSIEIAKGLSEIHQAQTKNSFSVVDDEGLFPDLKIASKVAITDVTLRYDTPSQNVAPKKKRKNRLLDEGDASDRTLISSGTKGSRRSLKDDSNGRLDLSKRETIKEDPEKEEGFDSSILIWTGAAVGGVTLLSAIIGGGAVAYWAFIQEPNKAQVTPEFSGSAALQ